MGKPLEDSTRVATEFTTIITLSIFFSVVGVLDTCAMVPMWQAADNSNELVLFLCLMDFRDQIQITRSGGSYL